VFLSLRSRTERDVQRAHAPPSVCVLELKGMFRERTLLRLFDHVVILLGYELVSATAETDKNGFVGPYLPHPLPLRIRCLGHFPSFNFFTADLFRKKAMTDPVGMYHHVLVTVHKFLNKVDYAANSEYAKYIIRNLQVDPGRIGNGMV